MLALLAGVFKATAVADDRRPVLIDSLEDLLADATTASDSLRVLFDIFDLSAGNDRRQAVRRVYETAVSACDTAAQIDAIKYSANLSLHDTLALDRLARYMDGYAPTPKTQEVKLFIRLLRIENEVLADTAGWTSANISGLIRSYSVDPPQDPYDRVAELYRVCAYLIKATHGDLLEAYLRKLARLVDASPLADGVVRNLVYTRSAPVFTANGSAAIAVTVDKRTLNIIDSLVHAYSDAGRHYRTLASNRYACYRRLLSNYEALTPAEQEQYFNTILNMAQTDRQIEMDMRNNPIAMAHYYMAKGRYAEALPLLKQAIEVPANKRYSRALYDELYNAAEHSGDRETQLEAARELIEHARLQDDGKNLDRLREIEIIRDINDLNELDKQRERENKDSEISGYRMAVGAALVLCLALCVWLAILMRRLSRRKQEVASCHNEVSRLCKERDELKIEKAKLIADIEEVRRTEKTKSDFINTMCHEIKTPLTAISEYTRLIVDCIPDDRRPYLDRFGTIIEQNMTILQTIVSDVLDMASLEHNTMSVTREACGIYSICTLAVDTVFKKGQSSKPAVKVRFNTAGHDDHTVSTDPARVAQVLVNLLANADKFTETGFIDLDFCVAPDGRQLLFSVTDTGIGIPDGKEEVIFERFRQLDSSVSGCGLGLYISRLLARLLGGDVKVDTTYHKGARFLFTLPL